MKTIQEYLKTQDRKAVIDAYLYRYMPERLLYENPDKSYEEVCERCVAKLEDLIDRLIDLKAEPNNEGMIFMAAHCFPDEFGSDIWFVLLKEEDLQDDWSCPYGFEFIPFKKAVGFHVADTYLTQHWLTDLLAHFLHETTWSGYEQEHLDEMTSEIDEALREAEDHGNDPDYFISHEEFVERMEESFGFEFEKRDPEQEMAFREVMKHVCKYNETCQKIEKRKLLKLIAEERKQKA